MLPDCGLETAAQLAEAMRTAIAEHTVTEGNKTLGVTVSFGVAELHEREGGDDLQHRADTALYRAKAEGRNRVETAA